MRGFTNQMRFGAAAVLVLGGAAWSAHLHQETPPYSGTSPQQIRELAQRIQQQPTSNTPLFVQTTGDRGFEMRRSSPTVQVSSTRPTPASTPPPSPASEAGAGAAETDTAVPTAPANPVQNIALMGVTHMGEDDRAWLVDVESQEREVVGEGEEAFGFTLKTIDDEQVLLVRGDEEFTIRMGDKHIPPPPGSEAVAASTPASTMPVSSYGGPSGRSDRRSRFSGSPSRSYSGSSSSRSYDRSSRSDYSSSRFSGRSFPSSSFMSGAFGNSRNNNRTPNFNRPTSNPQEARRRNVRLVGGGDPIESPDPFSNPQTLRRLGSTSSSAFGSSNARSNSRNSNSRGR